MRSIWGGIRILITAVVVTGVVAQFVHSLASVDDVPFFVVNFFSFFTILSNCAAAVVLAIGVVLCFRRPVDPAGYTIARISVVTYMATTGIVYNLLLRDISLDAGDMLPWADEIPHVWAPILVVLDWLLAPGRRPVAWRSLWAVVAFPIVWAVYSLVRGAAIGWYPYPFLNPAQPGGYGAVSLYVASIAGCILLVALAAAWASRLPTPGGRRR